MNIGVVGLGVMGGSMAVHLAAMGEGRAVNVFDVRPDVAGALSPPSGSLTPCSNAREVGERSDLVITCVYSPSDAETALLDPLSGVVAGLKTGSICIDTTTSTPELASLTRARCAEKGVRFLASPVTGRPPRMTMMIGGDASAFEAAKPILAGIAANLVFLGTVEAACMAKHVNQYITYANVLIACEGMATATKAGVPLEAFARVLQNGSANSSMLSFVLAEMLDQDPPIVPAPLRLVAKDVRLARASFDALGVHSAILGHVDETYGSAERGLEDEPFPSICQVVAERYGVTKS